MLRRCSPAPTRGRARPRGDRGRRPQPGDLRLARRVGLQHPRLRRRLPAGAGGARPDVLADGQPPLRRPDPRGRQPAGAAALRRAPTQVRPLAAKAGAARRARCTRSSTRRTPRSSPGWPSRSVAEPRSDGRAAVARDRRAGPRQRHAADVFDALTAREIPVEIVGLKGLLRLPEVAEVVATLTLLHDLTANADLLDLLTGPRWAIGPRDLALLGRRARSSPACGARGDGVRVDEELAARRRGRRPDRGRLRSPTRSTDPGDLRLLRGGARRASRCSPPSCASLRRARRRAAARPGPPDHRRHRDRRRARLVGLARPPRARRENLDLFVKAVAEFQAIDGAGDAAGAARVAPPRTSRAAASTSATPSEADSVKLLTVHRAKGLEWDVGVPGRRVRGEVPRRPVAHASGPPSAEVLPAPLRGDAADLPELRGYDKAALDELTEAHARTRAVEELRLGYVAFTRARTGSGSRRTCGARRARSRCGRRRTSVTVRAGARGPGCRAVDWPAEPSTDAPNPLLAEPASVRLAGRPGAHRRARAPARGGRAGARRHGLARRCAPSSSTCVEPRRSRVGRRARAAARPRRGPSAPRSSRCRCPRACRRPRWPGCATTRRVRPRAGPADAAAAVAGGAVRHPVPRLGRGAVRPAGPARPRRAARARRPRASTTRPTCGS